MVPISVINATSNVPDFFEHAPKDKTITTTNKTLTNFFDNFISIPSLYLFLIASLLAFSKKLSDHFLQIPFSFLFITISG
jgi:hypothetical protein